jgi:hypothetical protein
MISLIPSVVSKSNPSESSSKRPIAIVPEGNAYNSPNSFFFFSIHIN